MNKRNFWLCAALLVAFGANAESLSPSQALQRLNANGPARISSKIKADATPVYTAKTSADTPAAYLFNLDEGGFMVVAGDDMAYPLLGYSEAGRIDAAAMPAAMKWWLNEYGRQIEWASEHGFSAAKSPLRVEGRSAIAPLLTTKWDQDTPYNNLCPKKDGVLTYTGCVATSMAQVMNYHKYPEVGEGIKQYTCSSLGKRLTINFGQRAFDWDNMLTSYPAGTYTEEQAEAVAYLMKACGFSVDMQYNTDASGTAGYLIAPSLKQYFKYDKGVRDCYRIVYSSSQWDEMMYENLKNVGPVVVNGQSPLEGGHSFVCDGYDGDGYFHFNWGWSGVSDGFFALDALNPEAQGIGGFSGGFNFQQNAIFGIQPPKEGTVAPVGCLFQYGTSTGTIDGRTLTFSAKDYEILGWGNLSYENVSVYIGARIEPITAEGDVQYVQGKMGAMESISLDQGYYYSTDRAKPVFTLPELADGEYRVRLVCKDTQLENAEWMPVEVPWGYSNYVMLNVSGGNYTVTDVAPSVISFSDVENLTELYAGKNVVFSVKASNPSDVELCQGVCPHLLTSSGYVQFVGEGVLVSVNPGETETKEIVTKFYYKNGNVSSVGSDTSFTLKFFNPQTGLYYDGISIPVTLKPNPGVANIMLTLFTMPGWERQEMTINGRYFPLVNIVTDPEEIPVELSFKNKAGYFDGLVSFDISKLDPTNAYRTITVSDDIYSQMEFIGKDESVDINFTFDFPDIVENELYLLESTYTLGTSQNSFGFKAFMYKDPSGVEGVKVDNCDAEYFNLQGMPLSEPTPGEVIIVRKNGKTTKTICK